MTHPVFWSLWQHLYNAANQINQHTSTQLQVHALTYGTWQLFSTDHLDNPVVPLGFWGMWNRVCETEYTSMEH